MLTIEVFDEANIHFDRAIKALRGRFSKSKLKAATACPYRRALNAECHKTYTLILYPDASELPAHDQHRLRIAEQAAARRLTDDGRVLLAFGDFANGYACCSRILRLAGRTARHVGEMP
jgi:hypothetical protein